jgi:deoxyadenosine/deoxycytidine kinase/ribonuclease HI
MKRGSRIISIDGNIGSGKSTLYNFLKEKYKNNKEIGFVEEPVDTWNKIRDENDVPILTNLYKDTNKYAFRFQMMAYISRLSLLRKAVLSNNYQVIITERSVFTDKNIFAKMLHEDGAIATDEMAIYLQWFDEFINEVYPSSFVYVQATPEICEKRVIKRAREGENIALSYLQRCHAFHENWLGNMGENVVILDANLDLSKHPEIHEKWAEKIEQQFNYRSCKLYFDGACRGNPSNKLGLGFVIFQKNLKVLHEFKKPVEIESGTNNIAEYMALIEGLKYVVDEKIDYVDVYGDSDLIIKQVLGIYKVKALHLKPYHDMVKSYIDQIPKVVFQHIPRNENSHADKLANEALDNND